jgi:hypothetical protein
MEMTDKEIRNEGLLDGPLSLAQRTREMMSWCLDYSTKQIEGEAPGSVAFAAWLTDRDNIVYTGATEHEAIACMLRGVATLGWSRFLDPERPDKYTGMSHDPIQHAMDLLNGALSRELQARRNFVRDESDGVPDGRTTAQEKARLSELIGNLGTAIAALARVKHD